MSLSSRFAVAVHTLAVLGFLESHGVDKMASQEIAKSVNTNAVVIRNLLRLLKRAGLVKSKEGKAGGVSLARPAAQISLFDIYAAVEETSILSLTKNSEYKACPVSCSMKKLLPKLFNEVDLAVAHTLKGKTLKQFIKQIK